MDVVVTSDDRDWHDWAQQWVRRGGRSLILVASRGSDDEIRRNAVQALGQAVRAAGRDGQVIVSVGHGGASATDPAVGRVDLAPRDAFTLQRTHVFYSDDDRQSDRLVVERLDRAGPAGCRRVLRHPLGRNPSIEEVLLRNACGFDAPITGRSRQADRARASQRLSGRRRLAVRLAYEAVATVTRQFKVAEIVLLSCNIGNATLFVDRIAAFWGVRIVAYRSRVGVFRDVDGTYKLFLTQAPTGTGTAQEQARGGPELPTRDRYVTGGASDG